MFKKFLIFALVAVALSQAQDSSSLENQIKKGLERLKGLVKVAERGIESTAKDIKYKRDSVELIIENILERAGYHNEKAKDKIGEASEKAEQKAKDEKKPPATFKCIDKAEKETLKKLGDAKTKYETEVKKLEKIYPVIDAIAKPLQKFKAILDEQNKKATDALKACKNSACVKKILEDFRKGVELLDVELKKALKDVDVAFNNQFVKNSYGLLNAYAREVNKIQEDGAKAINNCLTGKFLFEGLFLF